MFCLFLKELLTIFSWSDLLVYQLVLGLGMVSSITKPDLLFSRESCTVHRTRLRETYAWSSHAYWHMYWAIKDIKLNNKSLFTRWLDVVSFKNLLHMTILSVRLSYIWILVQIGKYSCRFCKASCKWLRTRLLSSLSKKTMLTSSPTPFVLWWRNISLLIISGVPIPILDSSIP